MSLTIVNPSFGEVEQHPGDRLALDRGSITDLAGRIVCLFSNNKPNVAPFFDELERLLTEQLGVKRTTRASKLSSAFPASEEELRRAEGVQYLIDAVGD